MNIHLIIFFLLQSNGFQGPAGLSYLKPMVGIWEHETVQVLSNGQIVKEKGTAQIDFILDSTFLQLEVVLNRENSSRSYLQLIGFDPNTRQYKSTYFYSGTTIVVNESGHWNKNEGKMELQGVNPWASQLENGINIRSNIKIVSNNEFRLAVMELRAGGQWIEGYHTIFRRKP